MIRCLSFLLLSSSPAFAHDATIQVPSQLMPASSLGIQARLSELNKAGGGVLTLSGAGSVFVDRGTSLLIPSNVRLQGDAAHLQPNGYGMTIVGAHDQNLSYRSLRYPVLRMDDSSNATVYNIYMDGNQTGNILAGVAISAYRTNHATIISCSIQGARSRGIIAQSASHLTIKFVSVTLNRSADGSPEGGVGIWCSLCEHTRVDTASVYANDYYDAGPPNISAENRLGAYPPPPSGDPIYPPYNAPVVDEVAFYNGSDNSIQNCHIAFGNAAGIYLSGESSDTVRHNTVDHVRQNGLDIAHCTNCIISTNTVTNAELSGLSMGSDTNTTVEYNSISASGRWPATWKSAGVRHGAGIGSLELQGNTTGSHIHDNEIHAGDAEYPIWFWYYDGRPTGNTITANQLFHSGSNPCLSPGGEAASTNWQTDNPTASPATCH